MICAFLRDKEGLTTVEYAIAGGLLAVAVVAGFITQGFKVAAQLYWRKYHGISKK